MGQTITVTMRETDFSDAPDRLAFASYRMNEVQLNPMLPYKRDDQILHAFYHELMHFIYYFADMDFEHGKGCIHQDERFVNLTANLLHQAMTTMEYE
jgi:predicted SprT family Zn-dependent metalloprotease